VYEITVIGSGTDDTVKSGYGLMLRRVAWTYLKRGLLAPPPDATDVTGIVATLPDPD
jgi:hypothetical protein